MRFFSFAGWLTVLSFALFTSFSQVDGAVLPDNSTSSALNSQNQKQAPSLFHQIYSQLVLSPYGAIARALTADPSPDFWQRAISLGDTAQEYVEDLLRAASNDSIAENIAKFRETTEQVVASTQWLRDEMRSAAEAHGKTLEEISDELSWAFMDIAKDLDEAFPPHDRAPSHEERAAMTANIMTKTEESVVSMGRKYGMSEDGVRVHFRNIRLHIEPLIVITGDLIEQHPVLLDTLLFSVTIIILPEIWLLRPLLSLFGFGPYGPVKGSAAAWAQRRFWGRAVKAGSWFAHLQSAGMKLPRLPWEKISVGVGAGLGMIGTFAGCR